MKPLSNFMPSTNSTSCLRVLLWPMVMTPVLPTFSSKSAKRSPMCSSPLAEIVATLFIWLFSFTGIDIFFSSFTTAYTARSIPFFISVKFTPTSTFFNASLKMARASTVAVVVPSPASSFVLLATDFTKLAPMFANLSDSSMALATVTPSLVILTEP